MTGYVCKTCGGPSPMGVGFTSTAPGAREASRRLVTCGCGRSRAPGSLAGWYVLNEQGRLVVWTDDEQHAASLVADGPGWWMRPAMVQAVADELLGRYLRFGGELLRGRALLVEIVHQVVDMGQVAEALEYHGFAPRGDTATELALALVAPVDDEGVQP